MINKTMNIVYHDTKTVYFDVDRFYGTKEALDIFNKWIATVEFNVLNGKETPKMEFDVVSLQEGVKKGLVSYR